MIPGRFGDSGELFFEIDLIAADGNLFQVEALLDTGFTTGWLAIDVQDAESLGWSVVERDRLMQTARGEELFYIYAGKLILDGVEYTVPAHAGAAISEVLLGLQWLRKKRLVVDGAMEVLTLG